MNSPSDKTLTVAFLTSTGLESLGAILVLLGVVCLAVYYFGVQVNALLVASMVLEVGGVFAYIFLNKRSN